jgi:DNA polymerase eta
MASSPDFISSQNVGSQRKSSFTFKHLHQLASYSATTPLRTIAHVDLDAFYAQCEMVRLGVAEDQPLAVQQWQGLIAINYAARPFGLGRHITATEAKNLCPDIVLQHVATWKEGDEKWAYHDDAFKHMATHKVSLDPYRMESKKIFACVKEALPADLQRVEKAGIDELFLDLSAHVHSIMLERYPQLKQLPPYDDLSENLPHPDTTAIDWNVDGLIDLDVSELEEDDPDWDDIAMSIAAEIVRDVRAAVRAKLNYTCSAGVARNKMLAKLGSAHKKPNGQTIVRNRAIQNFLSGFKFTKIRMLGGKLGDQAVAVFNTDAVKDLLDVPLEQLQKLGDDTGVWLFSTIRGQDNSDVNPRTQIKSMLSAKSFRPSINSFEQALRWLRIFVADLFSRCVEEGVLENIRKPKSINLHHRQSGQARSKQAPVPQGKTLTEDILFDLAKALMAQIIVDGRAWPCANLSLSLGGFEDGITGNRGIDGFLVRGEEAKALTTRQKSPEDIDQPNEKRRKLDHPSIERFVTASSAGTSHESDTESVTSNPEVVPTESDVAGFCRRCHEPIPDSDKAEHDDWHFARDLDKEFRRADSNDVPHASSHHDRQLPASNPPTKKGRGRGKAAKSSATSGNLEKGQMRLKFGND